MLNYCFSAVPTASTSAAPAVPINVPAPSTLRGKTIDEIVNKWTGELDEQVREFNQYATELAVWDRALIENSNSVGFRLFHCVGMVVY